VTEEVHEEGENLPYVEEVRGLGSKCVAFLSPEGVSVLRVEEKVRDSQSVEHPEVAHFPKELVQTFC